MTAMTLMVSGCAGLAALVAAASWAQGDHLASKGPAGFHYSSDGRLVPFAANGRPFRLCGTDQQSCSIPNPKYSYIDVQTSEMQTTSTSDGYCEITAFAYNGKTYYYYDPNDPDCPQS